MATRADSIYQLKVTLKHVRPPVWRRLLVPADVKLPALHRILQAAMGWENSHLHQFLRGPDRYMERDLDEALPLAGERDERRVRLDALLTAPRQTLAYEYDFGDGWEHTILLERVIEADPAAAYPLCVAAGGACPPEDCGGPFGYRQLLDILADPGHDRHAEMRQWVDAEFDPQAVDLAAINRGLAPKRRRRAS